MGRRLLLYHANFLLFRPNCISSAPAVVMSAAPGARPSPCSGLERERLPFWSLRQLAEQARHRRVTEFLEEAGDGEARVLTERMAGISSSLAGADKRDRRGLAMT